MTQRTRKLAAVASQASVSHTKASSEPSLDRTIQARIGDNLRAMYDELLQQPVPDRFRDLLGKLDQNRDGKERGR